MFSIDNLDPLCYRYDQRDYEREVFKMVVKSYQLKEKIKSVYAELLILEREIYGDTDFLPETEFTPAISCLSEIYKNLEIKRG